MEAYTSFAEVYDTFMDNVPYEEWADYLEDRLKEYGVKDGLVLELGCGDGALWKQNISLLPQNIHLTLSDISDRKYDRTPG